MRGYLQRLWDKAEKQNCANIFSLVSKNSKTTFLDCGCGDGKFTLKVASRIGTNDIFGIEIIDEFISQAEQRGIIVKRADLNNKFPFDDATIDIICANQVIEHLISIDHFLAEIYRVLKPNGYVVLSTENLASWHNIFSLFLGWQPFSITNISKDKLGIGNPLALHRNETGSFSSLLHIRVLAYQALKEFFEIKGFVVEQILGAGYYPLPNFLAKVDPKHSAFLTFRLKRCIEDSTS